MIGNLQKIVTFDPHTWRHQIGKTMVLKYVHSHNWNHSMLCKTEHMTSERLVESLFYWSTLLRFCHTHTHSTQYCAHSVCISFQPQIIKIKKSWLCPPPELKASPGNNILVLTESPNECPPRASCTFDQTLQMISLFIVLQQFPEPNQMMKATVWYKG